MTPREPALDEFMTVAEVATILKLNPQPLRNWTDAGTLPTVRVGRRVRINRFDFDMFVQAAYSGVGAALPGDPERIWDGSVPALDKPK